MCRSILKASPARSLALTSTAQVTRGFVAQPDVQAVDQPAGQPVGQPAGQPDDASGISLMQMKSLGERPLAAERSC